jgi:site-specific DNA recombinase
MSSTDSRKRAILYARVSTEEQARNGYSLAQQLEALREYAAREGYEVFEVVRDPGQSGASLERPGMDRVRDLVAAGGVAMVLAQDRDRFAREPAYHYLLRKEFEEYGCRMRSLNDRGDDSPEGELTDGILDQLAKFERAKTAQRTRRGKLQKAREGKVLATHRPPYGFRYNEARDNYLVDAERMAVIERIFRMVGVEGYTMNATRLAFNREGVRSPSGGEFWSPKFVREAIRDDVYRSHTYGEVAELVSPEVAARLDPKKRYGIWWFNRRRYASKQVAVGGPEGRSYRRRIKVSDKPRSEWIAVPVPESGIPRQWVDAARGHQGQSAPER